MMSENVSVIFSSHVKINHEDYENRVIRDQLILEEVFAKQEKDEIYIHDSLSESEEVRPENKSSIDWRNVEDPVLRRKMRNRICAERARKKKANMIGALIAENELLKIQVKNLEEELLRLKQKILK